jgi:hypothetical protein
MLQIQPMLALVDNGGSCFKKGLATVAQLEFKVIINGFVNISLVHI